MTTNYRTRYNEMKPVYAKVVRYSPAEIKEIRTGLKMTQINFARLFPVSEFTIQSWESGRRLPYGPSSTLLQQFKDYVDQVKEEKRTFLEKLLPK